MIAIFTIELLIKIVSIIFGAIMVAFSYRAVYVIWGAFFTRKFKKAKKNHRYAILVAARNEEAVIGNLIESIRLQDYPSELVDIFVVADNCTDKTAQISRDLGAICYERDDMEHRTKGFALQYLVECIRRDYGIDSYEGYFLFDADNLLKRNFISKMNDAFDAGEKIITSYRNTKNFDDNWISASYAIHWLRTVRTEHRARSSFRLATRIQGTGFLFAWEVIKDGWNYTSLTEDRAFCADAVANGYTISYNDEAEFYDEQPIDVKTAVRQRIRWSKGHLQAFAETSGKLLGHIFYTGGMANRHVKENEQLTTGKRLLNNIRLRFMSYDMLSVVYPFSLMMVFQGLLFYIFRVILICGSLTYFTIELAPDAVQFIASLFRINLEINNLHIAILLFSIFSLLEILNTYLGGVITAAYVFIVERKRIMKIKWYKKIWFCITFPLFDLVDYVTASIALCKKVEWKPTPHNSSVKITDINEKVYK